MGRGRDEEVSSFRSTEPMMDGEKGGLWGEIVVEWPGTYFGMSAPAKNFLSTPPGVMTAIRITPPDDPSRAIASARAGGRDEGVDERGKIGRKKEGRKKRGGEQSVSES